MVAGIDEAGRGPLAGPVVAAAVILPRSNPIEGVNDSKQLTPKNREILYQVISKIAIAIGVGMADEKEIDELNILQATFRAMSKALNDLKTPPDCVFVDGPFIIPNLPFRQQAIVCGDQLSESIAAASIIAKVRRDRLMEDYDRLYPQYGFIQHKGYPTVRHLKAIATYGPCPIHRKTFSGVLKKIV